jgi:hypothetical protein
VGIACGFGEGGRRKGTPSCVAEAAAAAACRVARTTCAWLLFSAACTTHLPCACSALTPERYDAAETLVGLRSELSPDTTDALAAIELLAAIKPKEPKPKEPASTQPVSRATGEAPASKENVPASDGAPASLDKVFATMCMSKDDAPASKGTAAALVEDLGEMPTPKKPSDNHLPGTPVSESDEISLSEDCWRKACLAARLAAGLEEEEGLPSPIGGAVQSLCAVGVFDAPVVLDVARVGPRGEGRFIITCEYRRGRGSARAHRPTTGRSWVYNKEERMLTMTLGRAN